jgi:hypothetical protein
MKLNMPILFSTAQRTGSIALAPCPLQRVWPFYFMRLYSTMPLSGGGVHPIVYFGKSAVGAERTLQRRSTELSRWAPALWRSQ